MYQNIHDFLEYIYQTRTSKTKKEDFVRLLHEMGDPQLRLKCLHVAGTNGKGSTTDYLRSILQMHGYKVGSFTSPHLVVHNDRIRINNVNIPDDRLLEIGNRYLDVIEKYALSMFQIDMLISIIYFLEEKVDYAVYEVGMGGRLDNTNVIHPLMSIITNIGMDHMAILGDTYEKIAYEKAGIIKEGVPAITAERKACCLKVFDQKAKECHTAVKKIHAPGGRIIDGKVHFSYYGYDVVLNTIALYQTKNASLAIAAAEELRRKNIIPLKRDLILKGVESTFWQGRFEVLNTKPLIIVDGAHNEHGVRSILESVKALPSPRCIIVSILKDKQYAQMIDMLQEVCDELIVTSFDYYRVTPLEKLSSRQGVNSMADYKEAIAYAERKYSKGSILITGSLYFVSEVRSLFVKGE